MHAKLLISGCMQKRGGRGVVCQECMLLRTHPYNVKRSQVRDGALVIHLVHVNKACPAAHGTRPQGRWRRRLLGLPRHRVRSGPRWCRRKGGGEKLVCGMIIWRLHVRGDVVRSIVWM